MKTVLHTKVDKQTKEKAQRLAKELGVPLSLVIDTQLKQFVRSGRLLIEADPVVSEEVMDNLKNMSTEARQGKNISPTFDSVDEMFEYLA